MAILIKQNTQGLNQVPVCFIRKTTSVVDFVPQVSLHKFFGKASVSVEKPKDLDLDPVQQRSWKKMRFDVVANKGSTVLTNGDCILYGNTYHKIAHVENFVDENQLLIYHTIKDFAPITQVLVPPTPGVALCELLQQFTQIERDRVMLWNANFTLPSDNGTYIVAELVNSTITHRGKAHSVNEQGNLVNSVASGGIQEYRVSFFSRDNSALSFERMAENCFNSDLAFKINTQYQVGIANMVKKGSVTNEPTQIGGSMIQLISFAININYSNYAQVENTEAYITPTQASMLVDYGNES